MNIQETKRETCPTCAGMTFIKGICEVSPEWEGIKTPDQEVCTSDDVCAGQLCTPDTICPTCNGKGFVN